MSKLNTSAPEESIKVEETKQDEFSLDGTWWYGNPALTQKVSISWFRWLWARPERPDRPKNWDMYYNTNTRKIEIFFTERYTDNFDDKWIYEYNPDRSYNKWDIVYYDEWSGKKVYKANNIVPSWWFDKSFWDIVWIISWWAEQQRYFVRLFTVWDKNVLTWENVVDFDFSDTEYTWLNTSNTVFTPYSWLFLVYASCKWWEDSSEIYRSSKLQIDGNIRNVDSYSPTKITANSVTTWTDSVWWSINANTVTTINYEDATWIYTNNLYIGYMESATPIRLLTEVDSDTTLASSPVIWTNNWDGTNLTVIGL